MMKDLLVLETQSLEDPERLIHPGVPALRLENSRVPRTLELVLLVKSGPAINRMP
jgi:hypothetical protein